MGKVFESFDLIMDIVFRNGGCNHQDNNAYKEELEHLPYPYRNFKSGMKIDVMCSEIEYNTGIVLTENELIDRMIKHYNRRRDL